MTANTSRRRYELDWLRVFAILIVFVYHSSRFFNLGDWHIKNINTFVWVELWNVFATRWMMPLVYLVERERAGDSEWDHIVVYDSRFDVCGVLNPANDHEGDYSTRSSGSGQRWLGFSILYLVSDCRIHDFFQRPTPTAYYGSALDFSFTGPGFIDCPTVPVV
jgi:hypothetical protein